MRRPHRVAFLMALDTADEPVAEAPEVLDVRAEYERVFGKKPHPRMKDQTIRDRLSNADAE